MARIDKLAAIEASAVRTTYVAEAVGTSTNYSVASVRLVDRSAHEALDELISTPWTSVN